MKIIIACLFVTSLLCSCGSNAQKKAKELETSIKETVPGAVQTVANGYMMKAKLYGKDWEASSMMPANLGGRIVGYKNGEWIGLPYSKSGMVAGRKKVFGESSGVADLATNDEVAFWSGRKGEMEITKVDDNWIEGRFYFTATSSRSARIIEVTDGFFRIPVEK